WRARAVACLWLWAALFGGVFAQQNPGETRAESKTESLWERAQSHLEVGDEFSAAAVAEELLRERGLHPERKCGAWLMVARGYARYGTPAGWAKVRAASEAVLGGGGLRLRGPERLEALRLGAAAAVELRAHPQAELLQRALGTTPEIGRLERERVRLGLARSLWAQRAFEACRETLDQMEPGLIAMEGVGGEWRRREVEELRAQGQLLRGQSLWEEGRTTEARLLLAGIGTMPGQTSASSPAREAASLLHREGWIRGPHRIQRVLFIGSSHTIRGAVPLLVEQIAASAPPHRVRIVAGEQTRMGTGMRGHWNDGAAHDTARGKIAAGGWDTVVVETFYRTSREDLLGLGAGFAEAARRSGARLLVYETPVARAIEYPAAYEAHHANNVWLGARLGAGVAPCVRAWMGVLGERPAPADMDRLYADWIHASAKGAYLSACCLYAALTGESPEGLWAPEGVVSPEEARESQRSAWRAYEETRLELAREGLGSPGR
ncbi:MAG: hypothetical protein RLZZ142_1900, partial [Verrucomicrobiota bacterium]